MTKNTEDARSPFVALDASTAWASERKSYPREGYVAGYDRGAFDERLRLVAFISENQETLNSFAGPSGLEMLGYMLANMRPDWQPTDPRTLPTPAVTLPTRDGSPS